MLSNFSAFSQVSPLLSALALAACNGISAGVPATVAQAGAPATAILAHGNSGSTSCLTMTCVYEYSSNNKTGDGQITGYPSNVTAMPRLFRRWPG